MNSNRHVPRAERPCRKALSARDDPEDMLEIEHLTKRYGDIVALDDLSMRVRPGRIVGFLGPNGAGKTTAMRSVFGLARPDSGSVTWHGEAITDRTRMSFGYMPEERGLYPKMKIGEQLRHFARLSGLDGSQAKERVTEWLEQLGLGGRLDAKLEDLSHGNQQRVQLAAALVHDPILAALDEPFSGLDPLAVDDLADTLRKLATGGTAILFSSHQLDLVQTICQDVVVIDHGRVVLDGEVETLRHGSPYRVLIAEVDRRPWVPETAVTPLQIDGEGRSLVDRDIPIGTIMEEAEQHGTVTSFRFEPPSLSDLFRQAVSK